MGSPRGVPVPCTAKNATSAALSWPAASAAATSFCCAGPLGAVSPLLRPAVLMALPRTSASALLAAAPDRWTSTAATKPSPRP